MRTGRVPTNLSVGLAASLLLWGINPSEGSVEEPACRRLVVRCIETIDKCAVRSGPWRNTHVSIINSSGAILAQGFADSLGMAVFSSVASDLNAVRVEDLSERRHGSRYCREVLIAGVDTVTVEIKLTALCCKIGSIYR